MKKRCHQFQNVLRDVTVNLSSDEHQSKGLVTNFIKVLVRCFCWAHPEGAEGHFDRETSVCTVCQLTFFAHVLRTSQTAFRKFAPLKGQAVAANFCCSVHQAQSHRQRKMFISTNWRSWFGKCSSHRLPAWSHALSSCAPFSDSRTTWNGQCDRTKQCKIWMLGDSPFQKLHEILQTRFAGCFVLEKMPCGSMRENNALTDITDFHVQFESTWSDRVFYDAAKLWSRE